MSATRGSVNIAREIYRSLIETAIPVEVYIVRLIKLNASNVIYSNVLNALQSFQLLGSALSAYIQII